MTLSPTVFFLVLLAAVCHATWNAFVKAGDDKLAVQALVIVVPGLAASLALPFLPLPAPASWPYLLASVVIHQIYFLLLIYAYEHGDLSQVYPIARGSAPLVVALGALLLAAETLSGGQWLGLAVLSLGIVSLSRLAGVAAGLTRLHERELKAVGLALATALSIGLFSVADGQGVRASQHPLSYILWFFALQAVPIGLFALWRRRRGLRTAFGPSLKTGGFGGIIFGVAYGIAIWAMGVAPMAHVAALRETSVIIAAVIGTHMMGEPFGRRRIAAAVLVVAGAALLELGGE